MRLVSSGLGAWETIEADHQRKHGITYPLALVHRVVQDADLPEPEAWEPDHPTGPWDVVLLSAMDSRHFWRVAPTLRAMGVPLFAEDRGEHDPIVILGGQAASAPAPVEHMIDLVYVGEVEARGRDMFRALRAGSRRAKLESAAAVPGVLWPMAGGTVEAQYASDITTSLDGGISVSTTRNPRIEAARGCRYKCPFCVLGWRAPYRENNADDIRQTLRRLRAEGVGQVHITGADVESHSGISGIRDELRELGIRDHGWTGRMDTLKECSVDAGKYFAFGVEGMSHRLRAAMGKPHLTDDFIIDNMRRYWESGGRRVMWHMIGGLPTECDDDARQFRALLDAIVRVARDVGGRTGAGLSLDVGRQPFGPMPHTPMQWDAPGLQTDRIGRVLSDYVGGGGLHVLDKAGQSFRGALLATVAMRGGPEVQGLLMRDAPTLDREPRVAHAQFRAWLSRAHLDPEHYTSRWEVGCHLPWSHVTVWPGDRRVRLGRAAMERALSLS